MPNIPEFNLPAAQSKVDPRSEGASATMRAGRVIQETARSVGELQAQGWRQLGAAVGKIGNEADDFFTQRDISKAAEDHTKLTAQAAVDLPKILATAQDPVAAVRDYYDKTYAPAVENINGNMSTKRGRMWAAEHSQSGAQAFMRSGIAEAQSVSGARAIQSFQNSVNNLTSAAHSDPHALQGYLDQADSLLDGTKGSLTAAQQTQIEMHRNTVKQQLTIAAGHAMADQNPAQFEKDLAGGWGKGVLDETHRELLQHYAQYTGKRQARIQKGNSTGAVADWIAGKYDQQTGQDHEMTPNDIGQIVNNPSVMPEDKPSAQRFGVTMNRLQTWMQEHKIKGRGVPPGNAGAELSLRQRLGDPNNPTTLDEVTEQLEAYEKNPHNGINPAKALEIAKKIKPAKMAELGKLKNDPIMQGEIGRAEALIRNGTDDPKSNPAIMGKLDEFKRDMWRTLQEAQDRGENYKEYLDPHNPKYMFTPERIMQYQPSKKEIENKLFIPAPSQNTVKDSQFLKSNPNGTPAPRRSLNEIFKGRK